MVWRGKIAASNERAKATAAVIFDTSSTQVFQLDTGPPSTLFRYLHPSLAPYRPPGTGKGRGTPPFAYSRGFPNGSKVEVVHTGNLVGSASPPRYLTSAPCHHGLYVLVSVLGA